MRKRETNSLGKDGKDHGTKITDQRFQGKACGWYCGMPSDEPAGEIPAVLVWQQAAHGNHHPWALRTGDFYPGDLGRRPP